MRKFILPILLFLMFIPFIVNAETCDTDKITIENLTIENKSNNVEEIEEATANGKNISLNLSMSEIGDKIEYNFSIKNDSNEDYELDKTSLNLNSDYINYSFETDDNSNIVKANSSKNVTLRVEYKTEVPKDKFENGTYNDSRNVIIQLSNGKTINVPDTFKNPNTGVQSYIVIVLITLLISGSIYILLKKKKYTKFMMLIIGIAIIVPISIYALCGCDIIIISDIKIVKPKVCGSFSDDSWDVISNNVKNGNDNCYQVGDTKEVDMGEFGNHTLRIANKSTPSECNQDGFSQTACGFVIEFTDIISTLNYNNYTNGITAIGNGSKGGWEYSEIRTYVNTNIYNALPVKLRNSIINTIVVSGYDRTNDSENFITEDKIYLLDAKEIFGISYTDSYDTAKDNERQLDYYETNRVTTSNYTYTIKQHNGSDYNWWLRSARHYYMPCFHNVGSDGSSSYHFVYATYGVSPAFRIG